jgi:hypothetical protein
LAHFFVVTIQGMRATARLNSDRSALEQVAHVALAVFDGTHTEASQQDAVPDGAPPRARQPTVARTARWRRTSPQPSAASRRAWADVANVADRGTPRRRSSIETHVTGLINDSLVRRLCHEFLLKIVWMNTRHTSDGHPVDRHRESYQRQQYSSSCISIQRDDATSKNAAQLSVMTGCPFFRI